MKSIKTIVPDSDEDAFAVAMCNVLGVFVSGQERLEKSWNVEVTYTKLDALLQAFFLFGYYTKNGLDETN